MSHLPLRVLQGLLAYVCLSHIVIGAGAMLSPGFQRWMADLYGVQAELSPQVVYLARPLGAFMLVLGLMGLAAVRDPVRYRVLVYGFAGVLLLRDLQRLAHQQEITEVFGISQGWNLAVGAFFLALAVGLVVLLQVIQKGASPGGSVAPAAGGGQA
jgi:hypothetical protein